MSTRRLDPRTVVLTFRTTPGGLQLAGGGTAARASFSGTVIVGSTNSISAISPQIKASQTYRFATWSTAVLKLTTSSLRLQQAPTPLGFDSEDRLTDQRSALISLGEPV